MATHISSLDKCKRCGENIFYYDTVIVDGYLKKGKSALSKKAGFFLCTCEKCLTLEFPSYQQKNKSRVFNRMCPETQYAFDIPEEIYLKEKNKFVVKSLENFIAKYGNEEGQLRWDAYKQKQSITNTFEYKNKKYGMTLDDFVSYNKSRAVTLHNILKKYGEESGRIKWEEYKSIQRITKSEDYMISKYGIEKTKEINKSKALTIQNFILKYGKEIGKLKYEAVIKKHYSFHSKISQDFFEKIDLFISKKYTTYYAKKNIEYGVNLSGTYVKLDYFILELNLCIEFNGTLFHADPRVYLPNDTPNPY
jgi:hypothetical protein